MPGFGIKRVHICIPHAQAMNQMWRGTYLEQRLPAYVHEGSHLHVLCLCVSGVMFANSGERTVEVSARLG